jgi:diguanylate cyclase
MNREQSVSSEIKAQFQQSVRIDKLQLLYRQSSHGVLGSLFAGVFWALIVWDSAKDSTRFDVSIWIAGLAITSGLRLALFIAYRRVKPEGDEVLRWLAPYAITLLLSSAIWGIGSLMVIPSDSTLLLVVTYSFLVGLAGAALLAYGIYVWLTVLVVVLVLGPVVFVLVTKGTLLATMLGIAGLWFFMTAMRGLAVHNAAVDESFRLAHELRRATQIAQWQAQTDGLTGLKNRGAFIDAADAVMKLLSRDQRNTAMLAIDVDGFKQINDRHGHAAGDTALVTIAEVFRSVLRRSDVCGRLGGDEFAVLLPNTPPEAAFRVAEKLLRCAQEEPMVFRGTPVEITLSIGVASGESGVEELLALADNAMYEAKRRGKNQIAERHTVNAEREIVDGVGPS